MEFVEKSQLLSSVLSEKPSQLNDKMDGRKLKGKSFSWFKVGKKCEADVFLTCILTSSYTQNI